MVIGIPKEVKNNENRVAITPAGVHELTDAGHQIFIETNAGAGSGFSDEEYTDSGAKVLSTAREIFSLSEIIVKVKELLETEYALIKKGQILFTYLHLAPNPALTKVLLDKKVTGIAYETVQSSSGSLPLLIPMSEVAGRMSIQVGATLLQKYHGGSGMLLGGIPGVLPAEVLIIGGGVVGTNAAKMALGMGARVTIMDVNKARLGYLDDIFGGRVSTMLYNRYHAAQLIKKTDLLIGAVLVAGAKAPKTVTEAMVQAMKAGSVIVDVAIDQGGSIETIDRVTTHDNPYYIRHGVVHYSVANMPGAVPKTSTLALTGATLPHLVKIANLGAKAAMLEDHALLAGLNTYDGKLTCQGVAEAMGREYTAPLDLLN